MLLRTACHLRATAPDDKQDDDSDSENLETKREVEHINHYTLPRACPDAEFSFDASLAKQVWRPPTDDATFARVEEFLIQQKCHLPVSAGHHSQDTCLSVLLQTNYNIERTAQLLQYIPINRSDDRQACFGTFTLSAVFKGLAAQTCHHTMLAPCFLV